MARSIRSTSTSSPRRGRLLAAGTAGVLLASAPATAAIADPSPDPGQAVTLTCAGQTYDIVLTRGNGEWTPAFDAASTRVFQPVGFPETHFEVTGYNPDGSVAFHEQGNEPGAIKNGARHGQEVVTCTFESAFAGYDEFFGGYVEGSWGGTVLSVVHG